MIVPICFAYSQDFTGLQTGNSWKYYQVFEWGGIWNGYPESPPNFRRYYRMMTVTDGFMQSDTQYFHISVKDSGRYRDGLTWKNFSGTWNDTCYVVNGKVFTSNLGPNFGWTLRDTSDTTVTIRFETIDGAILKYVKKRTNSINDTSVARQEVGLLRRYDRHNRGSSYRYWDEIELLEFNGSPVDLNGATMIITNPVISQLPEVLYLYQNNPNPFYNSTIINFMLPASMASDTEVSLAIYNMHGQIIRTLFNGIVCAGSYSATWKGENNHGKQVPAGVYFCKLTAGEELEQARRIILKK